MNEMYDRIIDMLCITGKMPLNMIEDVCSYARKSIDNSLASADGTRLERKERRDHEVFGDIASFKKQYRSAWYDYENEYAYNFSMD